MPIHPPVTGVGAWSLRDYGGQVAARDVLRDAAPNRARKIRAEFALPFSGSADCSDNESPAMAESCLMLCAWSSHLERGRRGLREFSWFSRSRQVTQRQSEGTPCRSKGRSRRVSVAKLRLTKNAQCRSLETVSTLRRIIAVVLLALWLPATQYCTLVAAGVFADETQASAADDCCNTNDRCSRDACNLLENGVIKPANEMAKVLAPDLSACLCFICLRFVQPGVADESALMVSAPEHPLDWESTWHFVRRAAPLARAPSLVG